MNRFKMCLFLLILTAVHPALLAGELVFGVSALAPNPSRLVTIDLDTGALQLVGPPGMGAQVSLTVDLVARPSDGELFLDVNGTTSSLFHVNRQTGIATPIGPASLQHGLVFDSSDRLYTQLAPDQVDATGPLALVDIATGQPTSLGGPVLPRLFGMAFNRTDQLIYAITANGHSLYKLRLDGSIESTLPTNARAVAGALFFRGDNRLVGSNLAGQLFDIDTATGVTSNFRTIQGAYPVQGMAAMIPEPAAVVLAAVAFAVCSVGRPFSQRK